MSLFLVGDVNEHLEMANDFRRNASVSNFRLHSRRIVGRRFLDVLSANDGPHLTYLALEPGLHMYVFGRLVYEGRSDHSGYENVALALIKGTFTYTHALGQYTVVLASEDRLIIVNDCLGTSKLYYSADSRIFSNGFVSAAWLLQNRRIYIPAFYEFAYAGSLYGSDTFLMDIKVAKSRVLYTIDDVIVRTRSLPSSIEHWRWPDKITPFEIVQTLSKQLITTFRLYGVAEANGINLSLSGGYDSRLLLSVLLSLGLCPRLFTYGKDGEVDVKVARRIAARKGLHLDVVDKTNQPVHKPEQFSEIVSRDFFMFDGFKAGNGIFSNGADFHDRLERASERIVMNGSLGEIYRNFFYLRDGNFTTQDIVACFYSQYDPSSGGSYFNEGQFRVRVAKSIEVALGITSANLSRDDVERVYSEYRGQFWTGRDAQLNQRFGVMWFPFLEPAIISGTATLPISLKSLGVLQGLMIQYFDGELAAMDSAYPYGLASRRPYRARLLNWLNERRPMFVRRRSYRWQHRRAQVRPPWLSDAYLGEALDLSMPYTKRLFRTNLLFANELYNRVLTLEYLAQRLNFILPTDKECQDHWRLLPS